MYSSFEDKIYGNIVVYNDLGKADSYGTKFDLVIDSLKQVPTPTIEIDCSSKMMPFILGKDEMLHPLFEEDCKIKEPFCYDYAYSPTRVSKELFDDSVLDILVIDQDVETVICHLYYRYPELIPEGWEFIDDFAIMRNNIRAFIRLLRRIQYANLSELLV